MKRSAKSRRRSVHLVMGITEAEWHRCWQAVYARLGLTSETNRDVFFDGILKSAPLWRFVVRRRDGRRFWEACKVITTRSTTKLSRELTKVNARRGYPAAAYCSECDRYLPEGHSFGCAMRFVRPVRLRIHCFPRFAGRASTSSRRLTS